MKVRAQIRAGELTVYGTDWCGYTRKQRAYLDAKGIPYTYVNCEKQTCPNFVSAFPTMIQNGHMIKGYHAI
jgi:glutaredoxin